MDQVKLDNIAQNYTKITGNDNGFIYNMSKTKGADVLMSQIHQNYQNIINQQAALTDQHAIALNSMVDQLPTVANNVAQNISKETIAGGGFVGQIMANINNQTAAQETQMGLKNAMQNQQIQNSKESWAANLDKMQYTQV